MYTGTLWIGKREAGEGSGSGHVRVAEVGRLSWTVAESLRAFVECVIANFRDKNIVSTIERKKAIFGFQGTNLKTGSGCVSLRAQQKQDVFR